MNTASYFCPRCQQMKLYTQQTMSHTPHILATVFLCGLWLPVWILMAAADNQAWRCSFCGYSDKPRYLADPTLRAREQQIAAQRSEEYRRKQLAKGSQPTAIGEFLSTKDAVWKIGVAILGTLTLFILISVALKK